MPFSIFEKIQKWTNLKYWYILSFFVWKFAQQAKINFRENENFRSTLVLTGTYYMTKCSFFLPLIKAKTLVQCRLTSIVPGFLLAEQHQARPTTL
jgi:hypothetical protein